MLPPEGPGSQRGPGHRGGGRVTGGSRVTEGKPGHGAGAGALRRGQALLLPLCVALGLREVPPPRL